ncbi:hypothetical protein Tco_1026684 [Tanacetum coccineum]
MALEGNRTLTHYDILDGSLLLPKIKHMKTLGNYDIHPLSSFHLDIQQMHAAMEADEYLQLQKSSRTTTKTTPRELFDEEFKSGSEEVVYEEGEYESDGVQIMEDCGDED